MNKKQINKMVIAVIVIVVVAVSYFLISDIMEVKKLRARAKELQDKQAKGLLTEPEKQELNTVLDNLSQHKTGLFPTAKGTAVYANATQQVAEMKLSGNWSMLNVNPKAADLEFLNYPFVNDGDYLGTIIDKDATFVYLFLPNTGGFTTDRYFRVYPSQLKK